MTVTVSSVSLFDVAGGTMVPAELLDAITEKQMIDYEGEWLPELFKAVQKLARSGVDRRHWPQSRHWDWRRKTAALQGMLGNQGFSVVCDNVTQGMMFVDTVAKRCRLPAQRGQHLVYVDFIENAPWNRKELLFDPPRYRGIGSILVRAAVELSIQEEFRGRIGLHSLPQANWFYANTCGMTDMGPDDQYQGLRYFEMTMEQAEAFLIKGANQ